MPVYYNVQYVLFVTGPLPSQYAGENEKIQLYDGRKVGKISLQQGVDWQEGFFLPPVVIFFTAASFITASSSIHFVLSTLASFLPSRHVITP